MKLFIGVFFAVMTAILCMTIIHYINVELAYATRIYNKNFSFTCYDSKGKILISSTGTNFRLSRLFKNTIIDDNSKSIVVINDNCLITEIL